MVRVTGMRVGTGAVMLVVVPCCVVLCVVLCSVVLCFVVLWRVGL